jgi:hypothetical protein
MAFLGGSKIGGVGGGGEVVPLVGAQVCRVNCAFCQMRCRFATDFGRSFEGCLLMLVGVRCACGWEAKSGQVVCLARMFRLCNFDVA